MAAHLQIMKKSIALLSFYLLLHGVSVQCSASGETTGVPIGLILDSSLPTGKISPTCIDLALADFYDAHPNYTTRIVIRPRDSGGDIVAAASAALDLIANEGVHAIIGPQTSAEAAFVATMASASRLPVVSFTATSPTISPFRAPYFVRTAPADTAQAPAIAALVQAFGWRRVVLVYEETDYGAGLIPYLVDALDAVGAIVPYRSMLAAAATDDRISEELYALKTMQTRVFVVHMRIAMASRFFPLAEDAGMMGEGFAWIASSGVVGLLGSFDPYIVSSMQGVIGVKPHVPRKSAGFREFSRRFKLELTKQNPGTVITAGPSIYGLWAYETAWALALAVEAAGAGKGIESNGSSSVSDPAQLSSLPISESGERLLDAIHRTEFSVMGDEFRLVNGERSVSAYEVVNVLEETARGIGFWTSRHGLSRTLNPADSSDYSATRHGLSPVILWPGESKARPRGWETPTGGKKLKIVVPGPVEPGFHSFLNVATDPETGETIAGGFVIEVFEAAVRKLPYALPFEYVRYVNATGGTSAGDYNDLIKQVFLKKFDAVVGDITITVNRSQLVDFTLPYTVSGVSMVVPIKNEHSKDAWLFLKPLTTDLWLASAAFFVLTGAVVWVLEHRINDDFRGPPANQIGTVFYFTFSTLVFAHREKMVGNLSKIVMVIWVFVVLILQSSYTASLTSLLTVQRFEPTVTELETLIASRETVGYLEDSFVKGLLLKWGFRPKQLKPYKSPQQYRDGLALGSRNGGVAAVIDEVPYLKVFLKDYCDNYTMGPQLAKSAGFGFVFPKGSPVAADLSRAILNITDGEEMGGIEKRWFGDGSSCKSGGSTEIASGSLNFMSFWGLFAITGAASLLSLVGYFASFAYTNRSLWNRRDAGNLWARLRLMSRHFDGKDFTSHTFRYPRMKEESKSNQHASGGASIQEGQEERPTSVELMTPFSLTQTPLSFSGPLHEDGRIPGEL